MIRGEGYASLRRGRYSAEGAVYFVTFCTADRACGLTDLIEPILAMICRLDSEGIWKVRTGTVMPDHLHLLTCVRNAVALDQGIRLFKGRLSPLLRKKGLRWQNGFYERRLRDTDNLLAVFWYIFLNPYRARLIPCKETWPGYYCCSEDWAWFEALTESATAFPEWLGDG